MLNKYRADKTDANRINMVRARTEFKAVVRQIKRELDRAKTNALSIQSTEMRRSIGNF